MPREEFERLVGEEFPNAIPEEFRPKISNVAFLIEDEPSPEDREREGLRPNETLLGLYKGIPHTARGDFYGMGATLPDTITLYQFPIEDEATQMYEELAAKEGWTWPSGPERTLLWRSSEYISLLRQVIRETIWHELAHHFGMDESAVRRREDERQQEI